MMKQIFKKCDFCDNGTVLQKCNIETTAGPYFISVMCGVCQGKGYIPTDFYLEGNPYQGELTLEAV